MSQVFGCDTNDYFFHAWRYMCEGVGEDSVHGTWWVAFHSWPIEFHSRFT